MQYYAKRLQRFQFCMKKVFKYTGSYHSAIKPMKHYNYLQACRQKNTKDGYRMNIFQKAGWMTNYLRHNITSSCSARVGVLDTCNSHRSWRPTGWLVCHTDKRIANKNLSLWISLDLGIFQHRYTVKHTELQKEMLAVTNTDIPYIKTMYHNVDM